MKNYIGHNVVVTADGKAIKGQVLRDLQDRVLIRGKDGHILNIIKSKISMFFSLDDNIFLPLFVLGCDNAGLKCKGVKYIKHGKPTDDGYDMFMNACPMRNDNCKRGVFGNVFEIKEDVLVDMLSNTIYGDYPDDE